MSRPHIYIFIISLVLGGNFVGFSQNETDAETKVDSISYNEKYGFRLGVDLSKPVRTLIDDDYTGFEVKGDYRITKKLFPAAELGYEKFAFTENNLAVKSDGSYAKIGINYNAYNNWIGMQNEIYAGLRYGFATFSETLKAYEIYNTDHYFPPDVANPNNQFKDLNAHWIEFQLGFKTQVLNNLFLSIHAELKRVVNDKKPPNFDNLYIPGYNRNYENSAFGIGWGYSISYLIPISKKERKEEK